MSAIRQEKPTVPAAFPDGEHSDEFTKSSNFCSNCSSTWSRCASRNSPAFCSPRAPTGWCRRISASRRCRSPASGSSCSRSRRRTSPCAPVGAWRLQRPDSVAGSFSNVIATVAAAGMPAEALRTALSGMSVVPTITAHPTEAQARHGAGDPPPHLPPAGGTRIRPLDAARARHAPPATACRDRPALDDGRTPPRKAERGAGGRLGPPLLPRNAVPAHAGGGRATRRRPEAPLSGNRHRRPADPALLHLDRGRPTTATLRHRAGHPLGTRRIPPGRLSRLVGRVTTSSATSRSPRPWSACPTTSPSPSPRRCTRRVRPPRSSRAIPGRSSGSISPPSWKASRRPPANRAPPAPTRRRTISPARSRWRKRALVAVGAGELAATRVRPVRWEVEIFGFRTAALDIRQNSTVVNRTVAEIWRRLYPEQEIPEANSRSGARWSTASSPSPCRRCPTTSRRRQPRPWPPSPWCARAATGRTPPRSVRSSCR